VIACRRCGTDNPDNEAVCTACGVRLDDTAARALIGTLVLGAYEIVDVLGQGGMSVVYKARHKLTDQIVALKILPPELAVHAGLKSRFIEEAKALARLEHPNIVRLYNLGEEGGRFVLAMQYVEGITFERMIVGKGKVPWRDAVRIGTEVLEALDYAHGRGVVHRDIKPSNILVRADGTATVMDFGIAKMTAESSRLTATGQTMGTVRYMSPEQVKGQNVDLRSDLYSLGVTLFEAVVGDTPFDGNTHFEIMSKHLSEAPRAPTAAGAEIPDPLDQVILRSLRKDPAARYQTARDFTAALAAVAAGKALPEAGPEASILTVGSPALGTPLPVAPGGDAGAATGIASAIEPAVVASIRRRGHVGLWLGLAGLVAAASVGVIAFARRHRGGGPGGAEAAVDAAEAGGGDEIRPPLLVKGLAVAVDRRFGPPEEVRVIATRAVDAGHLARTYAAARTRFTDYLAREEIPQAAEVHPLNLVVAPPVTMCDPKLWPKGVPDNCQTTRYRYELTAWTAHVLDSPDLEVLNIQEAAAHHLCFSTPSLREVGCTKLVEPYLRELELEKGE